MVLQIEGKAKAVGDDLAQRLLTQARIDLDAGAPILSTHYIAVGEVAGRVKVFTWPYADAPKDSRVLFRAGLLTKVRERLLAGDSLTTNEMAEAKYAIQRSWP